MLYNHRAYATLHSLDLVNTPLPRIAAVLLLGYPGAGETYVVFTRRTETVARHQGQISLPGGSREPIDLTLAATALRETYEEVGVPADRVHLLGRLDDVHVWVSNFVITPYVGALEYRPTFVPDPSEVAQVIEIPLERLRSPDMFWEEDRPRENGEIHRLQFYRYGPHEIWGATGRVLQLFLASEFPDLLAQRVMRV